MDDLIEALTIFHRYSLDDRPTSCERDALFVHVAFEDVSHDDLVRLGQLGFEPSDVGNFVSYLFGST